MALNVYLKYHFDSFRGKELLIHSASAVQKTYSRNMFSLLLLHVVEASEEIA